MQEKFEDSKEGGNRKIIENTMTKRKKTKGQTTIYKTLHRKL